MATIAPRWLIYALGGGLGHLTRCLALGRAAARAGVSAVVLSNSDHATTIARHVDDELDGALTVEALAVGQNRRGVSRAVEQRLRRDDFDTLVVDTFPRGLAAELDRAIERGRYHKVLVHRDISPAYVEARGLEALLDSYDLVLAPGERGPLAEPAGAVETAAWLIRDRDELWPRQRARARLAAPADSPVVLVVGAGQAAEQNEHVQLAAALGSRLAGSAQVRLGTLHSSAATDRLELDGVAASVSHYPLLELMEGVDVLVGAGGYNTVHEARACGRPLLALARDRLYDRQARRLRSHERVASAAAIPGLVEARLAHWQPRPVTDYVSGCKAAVEAVLALS